MNEITITYDDASARRFVLASILWGLVGMLVGLFIALELAYPALNVLPELSFGRLRPLHTNAVIFAFVGNMIFAGVYYSTQRLLKTRMASDTLSKIHFWGWQSIIVGAALTLPFGITQSKEYAELEWPLDIAVAVIWLVFAANFFWTLAKRREKHLYVALWFYIATIITITILYVVNNLALPVLSGIKSYSIYAGVQDALIQWWYGHNAVAFFLTTPVLGIMYYFLPKAAGRPVYSYRLSIIHFWALIFLYIWAGPHHLLYTALPDWAQSMGMIFSVMLWAPSWGGMINGLLTLRGAWQKLRTDPVIKFFAAGVTFYGMATFEGPLLSIKSVSALGHYTDWIIGHVHTGALGWNGLMAAGMFYWMVPRLWNKKLHSEGAANFHFWIATLGILLYAVSMWVSGVTQGLMWRALNDDGGLLYPSFVETLVTIRPMYLMRAVGGGLYLFGFIILAWNIAMTIRGAQAVDGTARVFDVPEDHGPEVSWKVILLRPSMVLSVLVGALFLGFLASDLVSGVVMICAFTAAVFALWILWAQGAGKTGAAAAGKTHRLLEGKALLFTVLTTLAVLVGGIVELVPTLMMDRAVPEVGPVATPYSPLELHGRDIYVREGCYNCHSQMVRPFRSEKLRYGEPSTAGEFIYDHPFQWGSKRTGPDLHRVGGKYPNLWHYTHFMDPRQTSEGSNMPAYDWMAESTLDYGDTVLKVKAMKTLGVPYSAAEVSGSRAEAEAQAQAIALDLASQGAELPWDSEMVALIAYVQRLGLHPARPEAGVTQEP